MGKIKAELDKLSTRNIHGYYYFTNDKEVSTF